MPMLVSVNDRPVDLGEGSNVSLLLEQLGLHPARVAVELNGRIIPRADFGSVALGSGDKVEIVQLVGGG